jgi:hypothetical protein
MLGNLSLSKQFEIKAANRQPSCFIRIKHAGFYTANVVLNGTILQPLTMGARAGVLAGVFTKYRIIKAIFKHVPQSGSAAPGRVYMGVADEVGGEGGSSPIPQDYLGITALRCSTNVSLGGEGEFEWKPIDPNKWYYVFTAGTTNDQRFTVPGSFYAVTDGFGNSGTFNSRIEAYFTLEFAGDII